MRVLRGSWWNLNMIWDMSKDLKSYVYNLYQEVDGILNSLEEGGTPEGIFTEVCLGLLEEDEITESSLVCYEEKISKRGIEHKINAYALHENYETLDLFITDYDHDVELKVFHQKDFDLCLSRVKKFLQNVLYDSYIEVIDESHDVFELLLTLKKSELIAENLSRINLFILTNKVYEKEYDPTIQVAGYAAKVGLYDIGNLYKIQTHERKPIVIDLTGYDRKVYCVNPQIGNNDYYSILTAIPGNMIWDMYDTYTSKLLEQNVRSFLQFTGKINKGIKTTISNEPHMFMAFNNGISGTANLIEYGNDENGLYIEKIHDFQIVNGGQTTASIYHTKNKASNIALEEIFVPTKINIIKNESNFESIVSRIAEYSNTQNKVSVADLSSNKENHIKIEGLSRSVWSPPKEGSTVHTRWFYERSRGQYRNEMARNSGGKKNKRQFDSQNPRNQLITKELLAKYYNSYNLLWNGNKPLIGPYLVVKGAQKNYLHFLKDNFKFSPNKLWWEDAISTAILFKNAEQIYGVKPNALGDLRFAVVPYAISYLSWYTSGMINLEHIYKKQNIPDELKAILRSLMLAIEKFIKTKATGSLYAEYAKKQECWIALLEEKPLLTTTTVAPFLYSKSAFDIRSKKKRKKEDEDEIDLTKELEQIKSFSSNEWVKFASVIKEMEVSQSHYRTAMSISSKLKTYKLMDNNLINKAMMVLDIIAEKAPQIFVEIDEETTTYAPVIDIDSILITDKLLQEMVVFATDSRLLSQRQLALLFEIAHGMKPKNEYNLKFIRENMTVLIEAGMKVDN